MEKLSLSDLATDRPPRTRQPPQSAGSNAESELEPHPVERPRIRGFGPPSTVRTVPDNNACKEIIASKALSDLDQFQQQEQLRLSHPAPEFAPEAIPIRDQARSVRSLLSKILAVPINWREHTEVEWFDQLQIVRKHRQMKKSRGGACGDKATFLAAVSHGLSVRRPLREGGNIFETVNWLLDEDCDALYTIVRQHLTPVTDNSSRAVADMAEFVMVMWTVLSHEVASNRLLRILEVAVGAQGEVQPEQLQLAVCLLCGGAMPLCDKLLAWINQKLQQFTGRKDAATVPFYLSDLAPCLERMTRWVEGTGYEIPGPMLPYNASSMMSNVITRCVDDVETERMATQPNQE